MRDSLFDRKVLSGKAGSMTTARLFHLGLSAESGEGDRKCGVLGGEGDREGVGVLELEGHHMFSIGGE